MTPRTLREAGLRSNRSSYLGAKTWVSTGTHSADWLGDNRRITLAVTGVIVCGLAGLAVLIFNIGG